MNLRGYLWNISWEGFGGGAGEKSQLCQREKSQLCQSALFASEFLCDVCQGKAEVMFFKKVIN